MLDSDICIAWFKRNPSVVARLSSLQKEDLAISVIVAGELWVGVHKSFRPDKTATELNDLLDRVVVVPLAVATVLWYAHLRADLENRGLPIGVNDTWIASHCLSLGLTLVTNNEREFSRIPQLRIENWTR